MASFLRIFTTLQCTRKHFTYNNIVSKRSLLKQVFKICRLEITTRIISIFITEWKYFSFRKNLRSMNLCYECVESYHFTLTNHYITTERIYNRKRCNAPCYSSHRGHTRQAVVYIYTSWFPRDPAPLMRARADAYIYSLVYVRRDTHMNRFAPDASSRSLATNEHSAFPLAHPFRR